MAMDRLYTAEARAYGARTGAVTSSDERLDVELSRPSEMGGDGGAIVLNKDGAFAFPFNTDGMFRGWIGMDGIPHVAIFADEKMEGDTRPPVL